MAGKRRHASRAERLGERGVGRAVRRLFRKAQGFSWLAKIASRGRRAAYAQKRRALERICEISPGSIRVDTVDWEPAPQVLIGLTVEKHGRLHLVLEPEDHAPGGIWHLPLWDRVAEVVAAG